MTTIEKALEALKKYPGLSHRSTADTIVVDAPSPSGFDVFLQAKDNAFTVGFGGWHEHFDSEDDALNCFAFALIGNCRIRVHRRGTMECRWTLEYATDKGWREDSTTGLLFFPFWRRREIIYRQNPKLTPQSS